MLPELSCAIPKGLSRESPFFTSVFSCAVSKSTLAIFRNLCYNGGTNARRQKTMHREAMMSQITKRALEQSLKNLLLKKPLTKITINDIAEDCGINRITFYYHFKDIYDLVEW